MPSLTPSPSLLRYAILQALVWLHHRWLRALNTAVPTPYLDEVFHIPQAQTYWAGNFTHWDDKITTPPAVYLWSYAFNVVRRALWSEEAKAAAPGLGVEDLRYSGLALLYVLCLGLCALGSGIGRGNAVGDVVLFSEIVVCAMPLLVFFSTVYYTDVFSAASVVFTMVVWEMGRKRSGWRKGACQVAHVLLGLVGLASRQTNVFWVAVFLAGLQVFDTVSRRDGRVEDPVVGDAGVEDIFHLLFQLIPSAIRNLPPLLLDLWPHLTLLASFTAFVIWNGGVVLGDKSNHIATIHLPQLLYIWPFMVFFSWPALLPQFANLQQFRDRLPRVWLSVLIMGAMALAVRYNTIVHPFTLADNRHYVFYIFRLLMWKPWVKYAAVPVYYVCAVLVLGALGKANGGQGVGRVIGVRLSFVLVWFASTALSLVTAPLVEPRYFIVPWLVWRMYLPNTNISAPEEVEGVEKKGMVDKASEPNLLVKIMKMVATYHLWIELAWYLAVNYITCWIFLNWGFEWKQEPGIVQRFMW